MKLYHYTKKENLDNILAEGLIASSRYESFMELRKNVVFCWLYPDSQKIFDDDSVCLEITVDENSCIVAEMDYISFAMMYKYGGAKYGGKNVPVNLQAAELFVRLYEVTAIPIAEYADNFFSPEVLVKGNIDAKYIKIYQQESL